ncbi:MAG: tRNA lysidine(34) synthetase TilS [Candidatus Latescibacterota bacterium]|nr:MAG: tRNA lysidine(34) synthetase TilS [Candidatus Latescibacterota bacterium]
MSSDSVETPERLEDAVKWYIVSEELIRNDTLVVAAVSGGADSMAMLSILHRLSEDLKYRLAVGHFDHRLRSSSAAERAVVGEFAKSLSLPFHAGEDDVRSLANGSDDSLEEAARKARYRFLHELADRIGADYIATGHTQSDQIETVLMRILRGTGIRGLSGIPNRRGKVIRPLLRLERRETRAYCDSLGIPFVDDPSNEDKRFFRNRIRLDLLPLLEADYHSAAKENLLRLAHNAQSVVRTIRTKTDPLLEKDLREVSPGRWVLNVSQVGLMDETDIVVLFGDLFSEKLGCDMDFTRPHYEQIVRLVRGSRASGKKLSLPGLTLKREYEKLFITRSSSQTDGGGVLDHHVTVVFPGETRAAGFVIKTDIIDRAELEETSFKSTDREAFFDFQRLTPPLTLRSPIPGDRIQPYGMSGTKKLSDIFIDKKIPSSRRAGSLVITDKQSVHWVVGIVTSETSRVSEQTEKIVRIRFDKK